MTADNLWRRKIRVYMAMAMMEAPTTPPMVAPFVAAADTDAAPATATATDTDGIRDCVGEAAAMRVGGSETSAAEDICEEDTLRAAMMADEYDIDLTMVDHTLATAEPTAAAIEELELDMTGDCAAASALTYIRIL